MIITLSLVGLFILWIYIFTRQPQFGRLSKGIDAEKISQSTNYKKGKFQNKNPTPELTEGANYFSITKEFLFGKSKRGKPKQKLPAVKTDLFQLPPNENVLVWFGHSSYYMQIDGKKYLIDPVFCGFASPVNFTTKSFEGSDVYTCSDMPEIDYLIITHDHYDHLDYKTIKAIRPKIKEVITGLGVGSHLKHWGYDSQILQELDWNDSFIPYPGIKITSQTARHFSGRVFHRGKSIWSSFILTTPTKNIFIGGDSGYDNHFQIAGEQYGPFDLAILECGQYNKNWKHIHMFPEETVQATIDLNAKQLLPVHWSKFKLGLHDWDEPINRLVAEAEIKNVVVLTPRIGEKVLLDSPNQQFSHWWKNID